MAWSGRFIAKSLGPEWREFDALALLCEYARLSNLQAQALLLWCRGMSFAEMAPVLHKPNRHATRDYWRRAVRRLARSHAEAYTEEPRWAKMLLSCFRNTRGRADHSRLEQNTYTRAWEAPNRGLLITAADLGYAEAQDWVLRWLQQTREGQPRKGELVAV